MDPHSVFELHKLRLALGLGDQELEQRLRPALDATDELVVVAQCLAAEQLLAAVDARQVDVVVVGWSLHRLTDAVLAQLDRAPVRVVLLVPEIADPRWRDRAGRVLPVAADIAEIRAAVTDASASRPRAPRRAVAAPAPIPLKPADAAPVAPGVLAVWGGAGSPGRTTVAINLAYALGSVAPTVLVDLDLSASAVTAFLDRDPSRNVCTLAHAVRADAFAWSSALESELQPLTRAASLARVLCGPPKREMRGSLSPAFVERLVGELSRRFRYVIVDVGAELLGSDAAATNHRAALASASEILLVSGADLVSLWHTRTALDQLTQQLGRPRAAVPLVLNAYDARYHHGRPEIEWHLGTRVLATVPFDHVAIARAAAEQCPLLEISHGRAGRALHDLAERMHVGRLRLAPDAVPRVAPRRWWRRWLAGAAEPVPEPLPQYQPDPVVLGTTGRTDRRRSRA